MKSQTAAILASLVSLGVAAPVAECIAATTSSCTVITTTITTTSTLAGCVAAQTAAVANTGNADAAATAAAVAGTNVQTFSGTLGGPPPPVISGTGDRPFSVNGNTFTGVGAALGRSCDVQHNACANAANSGQLSGGVGACDQQNNECRNFIAKRRLLDIFQEKAVTPLIPRALNLGSCSDPTIVFEEGLDGRNTAAFIASNQKDFNHGSALGIGIIAGFICQRLDSSCKAPADVVATCASASAAAVAANPDQAAADAFNNIINAGVPAAAAPVATANLATTASQALVAVETGIVVQTITSCT